MSAHDAELWQLIEDSDFVTTDGFMEFARTRSDVTYWKRDFIARSGTWRGAKCAPLLGAPRDPSASTVVIGHSDLETRAGIQWALRARGYRAIWGTNVVARPSHSSPIPLGLTNDCDDSPIHRVLGKTDHLREAFMSTERPTRETGKVLACFTVGTAPRYRQPLAALIRGDSAFHWYEPEISDSGRIRFMSQLRTHDFVLCPRGNGVDTHRLWETLYMGGIPIVRRRDCWLPLLTDLPVVVVDEWSEALDPDFRSREWHRISHEEWSMTSLRQSTWIARILAAIGPSG